MIICNIACTQLQLTVSYYTICKYYEFNDYAIVIRLIISYVKQKRHYSVNV